MFNRSSISPNALPFASLLLAAMVLAAGLIAGCSPIIGGPGTPAYQGYLYMTDTYAGKVYAYDPATHTPLASSIAATGKNGTGEISFFKGIGYVAVGSGTDEGVYRFDPSATNPTFTKIGAGIAAQYFAFFSPTKAYVSSFDFSGPTAGLYSFDPTNPSEGLTTVAALSGKMLEDVVVGADGYVYAADNGKGEVLRINPSTDTVKDAITTTTGGTTGLAKGIFNGAQGIFVANTGGYDSSYNALPGSIDFIAVTSATSSLVANNAAGVSIYPASLVQLSGGGIVATGFDHTYLVSLSGATATVKELTADRGASFGSLDIAYKDGLVYIPVGDYLTKTSKLYVLDATGAQQSYSPVSVMESGTDMITNIGFYE